MYTFYWAVLIQVSPIFDGDLPNSHLREDKVEPLNVTESIAYNNLSSYLYELVSVSNTCPKCSIAIDADLPGAHYSFRTWHGLIPLTQVYIL